MTGHHTRLIVLTVLATVVVVISVYVPKEFTPEELSALSMDDLHSYAEQGNALAQTRLGHKYRGGDGVVKSTTEAVRWFRLAAEQGHVVAQFNLGLSYRTGRGVPQDHAEAVRWYRLAAEQGHLDAQTSLGRAYRDGLGVQLNPVQAHMWYNIASAQQGDVPYVSAAEVRDLIGNVMSPNQIAEAERLALEWESRQR